MAKYEEELSHLTEESLSIEQRMHAQLVERELATDDLLRDREGKVQSQYKRSIASLQKRIVMMEADHKHQCKDLELAFQLSLDSTMRSLKVSPSI